MNEKRLIIFKFSLIVASLIIVTGVVTFAELNSFAVQLVPFAILAVVIWTFVQMGIGSMPEKEKEGEE